MGVRLVAVGSGRAGDIDLAVGDVEAIGRGAGLGVCFCWVGYGFSCWATAVSVAPSSVIANSEIMAVSFIAFTPLARVDSALRAGLSWAGNRSSDELLFPV